jgi:hypothetical protein
MSYLKSLLAGFGVCAALVFGAPSSGNALVIYNANLATGPLSSPGSVSTNFNALSAGSGSIAFQIAGYRSLDGNNFYRDNFSLFVNNVLAFAGTFDLGGGGSNLVTFVLPGFSSFLVNPTSTGAPTWNGGTADIVAPIVFLAGLNTLRFEYASPGFPFAGPQGLGDEGWGINTVTVTSAVPEPSTWAMMLFGFAGLAYATRRRREPVAV